MTIKPMATRHVMMVKLYALRAHGARAREEKTAYAKRAAP